METRNFLLKTYLITWYGPFHNIEEAKECEQKSNTNSNLYLLQGKRKNARLFSYYCGKTERSATIRLKDKYHHVCEIQNHLNIWVGVFDNRFKIEDIGIAENLLIHSLSNRISEPQLINERGLNFNYSNSVCLISQWRNPKLYRQPENSIKLALPEVIVYNAVTGEVKISKRLHYL